MTKVQIRSSLASLLSDEQKGLSVNGDSSTGTASDTGDALSDKSLLC